MSDNILKISHPQVIMDFFLTVQCVYYSYLHR